MISKEEIKFIKDNIREDTIKLALKKGRASFVNDRTLEQIRSRQKAKKKLPEFYNNYDLIFPSSLSVEQSSSELTAKFKAEIFRGEILVDLTGGFGIDSFYLRNNFKKIFLIERNKKLSQIVKYNFNRLGIKNIEIINNDSAQILNNLEFDSLLIDPDRRVNSKKNFLIKDLEPDLFEIFNNYDLKDKEILIKMSPMFEPSEINILSDRDKDIYAVSIKNELKELLFLYKKSQTSSRSISVILNEKQSISSSINHSNYEIKYAEPMAFIYEPNVSLLKLDQHDELAANLDLFKIAPNTHFYTSTKLIHDPFFQAYIILQVSNYKASEIVYHKTNIKYRNFPDDHQKIKKKLKLSEGGEIYSFFFRDLKNKLRIVQTKKAT